MPQTEPGICSRRCGGRAVLARDQGVWRSVAASNKATWLPAVASAITSPAGPNAAAVTAPPSCLITKGSALSIETLCVLLARKDCSTNSSAVNQAASTVKSGEKQVLDLKDGQAAMVLHGSQVVEMGQARGD